MSSALDYTNKHLPQLDGIRGVAIIMVLIYHFIAISPSPNTDLENTIFTFTKSGWIGVDLFFVLSGFLITRILLTTKDKEKYYLNFYVKRVLRIFPLYYLVLIILLIIVPSLIANIPSQLQLMSDNQLWFWTYLANWYIAYEGDFNKTSGGYFWSLAVEEQFYIVWPFVVYNFRLFSFQKACVLLFVLTYILRNIMLFSGFSTTSVYVATITHMDGLLIGAWLATVLIDCKNIVLIRKLLNLSAVISLLLLVSFYLYDKSFYFWNFLVASTGYTLLSILFAAILFESVVNAESKMNLFFGSGLLRNVGKYSYAMYLFHVPISKQLYSKFYGIKLITMQPLIIQWFEFVLFSSLITFIISYISWYCFEKHFIKFKVYFEVNK